MARRSRTVRARRGRVARTCRRSVDGLGYRRSIWVFLETAEWSLKSADLVAEVDACLYLIDCLPNMDADLVAERGEAFVKILRDRRPNDPILMVEDRTMVMRSSRPIGPIGMKHLVRSIALFSIN